MRKMIAANGANEHESKKTVRRRFAQSGRRSRKANGCLRSHLPRARKEWPSGQRAGQSSRCCVSRCATLEQGFSGFGFDGVLSRYESWRLSPAAVAALWVIADGKPTAKSLI